MRVVANQYGVILILCMVVAAVFLLVRSGTINNSFDKLLQQEDHTKENKEFNRKVLPIDCHQIRKKEKDKQ